MVSFGHLGRSLCFLIVPSFFKLVFKISFSTPKNLLLFLCLVLSTFVPVLSHQDKEKGWLFDLFLTFIVALKALRVSG